jgi:hypothetical protein
MQSPTTNSYQQLQPSLAAPLAHPLFQAMLNWNVVQHLKIQLNKNGVNAVPQAVISEFDQETLYNPVTARLYNRGACVSAFADAANCSKSRAREGTFFIRKNLLHRALPLQPQEQCHQLHK